MDDQYYLIDKDNALSAMGVVSVRAFVVANELPPGIKEEKIDDRQARREKKNIRQCNVDVPNYLHKGIKEFARRARLGESVRDCILGMLAVLKLEDSLGPDELHDLEAALKMLDIN